MSKNDKNNKPEIEIAWEDFQYNMSAALYIITEQRALIGRLMEELVRVGALNNESLNRITDTMADPESLTSLYADIYQQFTKYVHVAKSLFEPQDEDK